MNNKALVRIDQDTLLAYMENGCTKYLTEKEMDKFTEVSGFKWRTYLGELEPYEVIANSAGTL